MNQPIEQKRPSTGALMEVGTHVELFHSNKWYFAWQIKENGPQYWEMESLSKPAPWGTYIYKFEENE